MQSESTWNGILRVSFTVEWLRAQNIYFHSVTLFLLVLLCRALWFREKKFISRLKALRLRPFIFLCLNYGQFFILHMHTISYQFLLFLAAARKGKKTLQEAKKWLRLYLQRYQFPQFSRMRIKVRAKNYFRIMRFMVFLYSR